MAVKSFGEKGPERDKNGAFADAGSREVYALTAGNVGLFLTSEDRRDITLKGGWRRGWDSNPRYALTAYNGLANRRLQPLGHLSAQFAARGSICGTCIGITSVNIE